MPNLLVFMTPGIGLRTWQELGILSREVKPYVEYARRGWKVKILTFDTHDIPELPEGIEAVKFPHPRLLLFLPWLCKELGTWADLLKTNQSHNAYYYAAAAHFWKKPLLLRCGNVRGEFLETTRGLTREVKAYQWLEAKSFRTAQHCEVPSEELAYWVKRNYAVAGDKVSVVPNFVDTDLFKPSPGKECQPKSVVSVGRLAPVKRFDLLVEACAMIPGCTLTVIGAGPARSKIASLAAQAEVPLSLPGNVPNDCLPGVLQAHMVFATTSQWEGHPKALIEAMACGMPCLAVEAPGISNVIRQGKNGWLVEPEAAAVKTGLENLFARESLRRSLGTGGRNFVLAHYRFEAVIEKELKVSEKLVERNGDT